MTYPEAEAFLLSLPRFTDAGADAYQPGLDRMHALLDALGNPHRAYPVVHVAGTNGKGSTASITAALLAVAGYRMGLHTSPHLWHLAERMRVNGQQAGENWIANAVARHCTAIKKVSPSFFEATVALSLLYFAEQQVDAAVVEVGLGGRLDATNVVESTVALVTAVALDHTDLLGDTLGKIAREKAGIFRPGTPALTSAAAPEALAALRAHADHLGAPFEWVQDTVALDDSEAGLTMTTPRAVYPELRLGLAGAHQRWNAALAVRGVETFLARALDPAEVRTALADVTRLSGLRARLQELQHSPRVLADVAHNPDGLAVALDAARPEGEGRLHVLFGLMQDKDAPAMARLLARHHATVYPVLLDGARALPAPALARTLAQAGVQVAPPVTTRAGLAAFQATAGLHDVLLITGSHQVVAGLEAEYFAETRQSSTR